MKNEKSEKSDIHFLSLPHKKNDIFCFFSLQPLKN